MKKIVFIISFSIFFLSRGICSTRFYIEPFIEGSIISSTATNVQYINYDSNSEDNNESYGSWRVLDKMQWGPFFGARASYEYYFLFISGKLSYSPFSFQKRYLRNSVGYGSYDYFDFTSAFESTLEGGILLPLNFFISYGYSPFLFHKRKDQGSKQDWYYYGSSQNFGIGFRSSMFSLHAVVKITDLNKEKYIENNQVKTKNYPYSGNCSDEGLNCTKYTLTSFLDNTFHLSLGIPFDI